MPVLHLLYGVGSYLLFSATLLYTIAFVGNLPVPKTIDVGPASPLGEAVAVNLLLLGVFAVQHSVMARRGFKQWWTRVVPEPVERSTFVLAATAALGLLIAEWRPMPTPVVWSVQNPIAVLALQAVFWLGWIVLLVSTFLIDHFELFGLGQVWSALRGRRMPASDFRTPGFYRHVRHPIYLGFLLAFWAAPTMTAGHLMFAAGCTGYILIGIAFEERDLVVQFGERYRVYRQQVGMLLPWLGRSVRGKPAGP